MKADNALEVLLNLDQAAEGTVQSRQKRMDLPPGVLHPKRLLASDGTSKSPVVMVSLIWYMHSNDYVTIFARIFRFK